MSANRRVAFGRLSNGDQRGAEDGLVGGNDVGGIETGAVLLMVGGGVSIIKQE